MSQQSAVHNNVVDFGVESLENPTTQEQIRKVFDPIKEAVFEVIHNRPEMTIAARNGSLKVALMGEAVGKVLTGQDIWNLTVGNIHTSTREFVLNKAAGGDHKISEYKTIDMKAKTVEGDSNVHQFETLAEQAGEGGQRNPKVKVVAA